VPKITDEGEIDLFILSLMDDETPQRVIASKVTERFNSRFTRWQDALSRVGELSQKYSK
jgi:hypothetical protein